MELFLLLALLLLAGARAEEEATFAGATHDMVSTAATAGTTITGTRTNCEVVPAVAVKANVAATEVVLLCRHGLRPGAPCCSAVVSYVDVAGMCRISNEPQFILTRINASRVLALYAACQGNVGILFLVCFNLDRNVLVFVTSLVASIFFLGFRFLAPCHPGVVISCRTWTALPLR